MGENGITISQQTSEKKVEIFDDEDLLSDEEKAAMAEDEDSEDRTQADDLQKADDEAAAAAEKAQEAADEKEKADEIKKADEAIAAEKQKTGAEDGSAKGADEGAKASDQEGGAEPGDADQPKSYSQAQPPLSMDLLTPEQVDGIKADLDKAKQQFNDGEIDYDTYFDQRLQLERQLWKNDFAAELSGSSIENQWQWEQETFLNDRQNDWIAGDDVVYSAFAATVNRIMSTEEGAVMPGPQILDQAREEVAKRFSPTREQDAQAAADQRRGKDAIRGAKASQANKDIPETLGKLPAAEGEDGGGEFSYLDKLDGEAFERAVEALSPAQLARYENTL